LDQIRFRCSNECEVVSFPAPWRINWTIEDQTLPHPDINDGHFVDGQGNRATTLTDRDSVLYQPPWDLAENETRTVSIFARVEDWAGNPLQVDAFFVTNEIKVTVTRGAAPDYFTVEAELVSQQGGGLPGAALFCPPNEPPACCTRTGGGFLVGGTPSGLILPTSSGMLTEVLRPITILGGAMASAPLECGFFQDYPDPCNDDNAFTSVSTEVDYTWVFTTNTAGAVLYHSNENGNTVFIEGKNPGKVALQLTMVNAATGDTQVLSGWEIQFYDLNLINQNNDLLRNIPLAHNAPGDQALDYGLSPSLTSISGLTLNAASNTVPPGPTPTWDGPKPVAPQIVDPNTYRYQIGASDQIAIPETYRVALDRHSGQSGIFDEVKYLSIPDPAGPAAGKYLHRTKEHWKITPINRYFATTEPGAVYDDEAAGKDTNTNKPDQTILAQHGDWIESRLERSLDNGQTWIAVGSRLHPIGRPWTEKFNEGNGTHHLPRPTKTFQAAGIISVESPEFPQVAWIQPETILGATDGASWAIELQEKLKRESQVLQQAGVQYDGSLVEVREVQPRRNFIVCNGNSPNNTFTPALNGTLTSTLVSPTGSTHVVTTSFTTQQVLTTILENHTLAIGALSGLSGKVKIYVPAEWLATIVVDPGPTSGWKFNEVKVDPPGTNLLIELPVQTWNSKEKTFWEAGTLQINGRPGLESQPYPWLTTRIPIVVLHGSKVGNLGTSSGVANSWRAPNPDVPENPFGGCVNLPHVRARRADWLMDFSILAHELTHLMANMKHINEFKDGGYELPGSPLDGDHLMMPHQGWRAYPESFSPDPNTNPNATIYLPGHPAYLNRDHANHRITTVEIGKLRSFSKLATKSFKIPLW
jgi:hypothetical protein